MKERKMGTYEVTVNENGIVESVIETWSGRRKYIYTYSEAYSAFVRRDDVKFTTLKSGYYKGTYYLK